MKKRKTVSTFCAVLCLLLMVIPAFARASDQLNDYWMVVSSSNNQIQVEFQVEGTDTMDRIGCESIFVYESSGGRWVEVDHLDENDPGMSRSNTYRFTNLVSVNCEVGVRYKVVVTVFAEDSAGQRDAREQTFYVTGAA